MTSNQIIERNMRRIQQNIWILCLTNEIQVNFNCFCWKSPLWLDHLWRIRIKFKLKQLFSSGFQSSPRGQSSEIFTDWKFFPVVSNILKCPVMKCLMRFSNDSDWTIQLANQKRGRRKRAWVGLRTQRLKRTLIPMPMGFISMTFSISFSCVNLTPCLFSTYDPSSGSEKWIAGNWPFPDKLNSIGTASGDWFGIRQTAPTVMG